MDRLAQRLAAEIPQRHVDGAHGMDHHAAPPVHGRAEIELLPQRPDLEGIGPHQHVADGEPHGVGPGRLDAGLGHPGIGVAFADSRHPLIGMDGDDQAVLGRGGEGRVVVRRQQDMAIDAGDAQPRRGAVETGRDRVHGTRQLEGDAGRGRSRDAAVEARRYRRRIGSGYMERIGRQPAARARGDACPPLAAGPTGYAKGLKLPSLAEILHPGIAHDGDDRRVGRQAFGQSEGGDDIGAGGCAGKKPFLPRQPKGHGLCLFC